MSAIISKIGFAQEYRMISEFYGDKVAKRSQVPLMNHIDEGLKILEEMFATSATKAAFCLHPIIQNDECFRDNIRDLIKGHLSQETLMLALEYRRAANAYLCKPYTDEWTQFEISQAVGYLTHEVKQMLIADKLQNQKDFKIHHFGKHHRSAQLDNYFMNWIEYLAKNMQ